MPYKNSIFICREREAKDTYGLDEEDLRVPEIQNDVINKYESQGKS